MKLDWAKIIDVLQDYFQVLFMSEENYSNVFFNWRPFFLANTTVGRKLAVWIRILDLPIELYNDKSVWRLSSTFKNCTMINSY